MSVALVLGLDIGSTTTKAALVAVADDVVVVRVARTTTPASPAELIGAAAAVTRECLVGANGPIVAVGIASMAESGAALGADGTPLTPLLRWDRRVDPRHLDDLLARHPDLPSRTGVPATTKPAAVALTALAVEKPERFAAMRHWAGAADLVAHALTGRRATDHTLAARTMMAGSRGDGWDAAVLDGIGVDAAVLPEVRAPGEPVAETSDAARAFGLPRGVPVHIAGHDHAVGAWASGVRAPGAVADSLGTAQAVVRVIPDLGPRAARRDTAGDAADAAAVGAARTDAAGADVTAAAGVAAGAEIEAVDPAVVDAVANGFSVGRTVDGSARTILGGSRACGAMLAWWADEHPEDHVWSHLSSATAEPWSTSAMTVLPYPSGRQCPHPRSGARVVLRDASADPADRSRAVLQALVFQARWMREVSDTHAGSPATAIAVLGSLARRIPAWVPLTATAGLPTRRIIPAEPVAAGAALLAAVRAGEASADLMLPGEDVEPARAPGLDDAYRRFLATACEGDS
jgi:xylulokinase